MFSPLFQRGGRGDFCIQLSYKGPIDRFYNSITFFQNFSTVKAQYLQTKRGQVPITISISQGVIASQVL